MIRPHAVRAVQRRIRVLEHDLQRLDLRPCCARPRGRQRVPVELDDAVRRRARQAEQHAGQRGLAAARFADQAQRLAGPTARTSMSRRACDACAARRRKVLARSLDRAAPARAPASRAPLRRQLGRRRARQVAAPRSWKWQRLDRPSPSVDQRRRLVAADARAPGRSGRRRRSRGSAPGDGRQESRGWCRAAARACRGPRRGRQRSRPTV